MEGEKKARRSHLERMDKINKMDNMDGDEVAVLDKTHQNFDCSTLHFPFLPA